MKTLNDYLDETARKYERTCWQDITNEMHAGATDWIDMQVMLLEASEAYAEDRCREQSSKEWISIDEILPGLAEHGDEIISSTVIVTDGEYQDYGHVNDKGDWKCYGMFLNAKCITHWMPKPNLPRTTPRHRG